MTSTSVDPVSSINYLKEKEESRGLLLGLECGKGEKWVLGLYSLLTLPSISRV